MPMLNLAETLLQHQNPDGGWGYAPGQGSRLEPTAWILLALQRRSVLPEKMQGALAWLLHQQQTDGAFLSTPAADFSRWNTALACVVLTAFSARSQALTEAGDRALRALLHDRARPARRKNDALAGDLVGWGWTNNAFSWIEPTAYGLWALRFRAILPELQETADFRAQQAEAILQARRCQDGGWNYGNTTSSDYALGSFPVPTALALLALARSSQTWDLEPAWQKLDQLLQTQPSLLSLSLGCIAAQAHRRTVESWQQKIPHHLDTLPSQANWGRGLALYALTA